MITLEAEPTPDLKIHAATAADLMSPAPVLIPEATAAEDALALLAEGRWGAAPVIDTEGRPVGVVSRDDLLARPRSGAAPESLPDYYTRSELSRRLPRPAGPSGTTPADARPAGPDTAGDAMAPLVFSVQFETPASQVIEELVAWHIQRLFVLDRGGRLIGLVDALDLLNRLHP